MNYKSVEIEGKTVTLKSKEGYPLAQSSFKTLDEAWEVANKKSNEMVKA